MESYQPEMWRLYFIGWPVVLTRHTLNVGSLAEYPKREKKGGEQYS